MPLPLYLVRVLGVAALAAVAVTMPHADTIVLKNGGRIAATGVVRENGKVGYETPAGHLSLPESIVERVEKDDTGGVDAPSNRNTTDLMIAPPFKAATAATGLVASLVVHDDAIDRQALAHLHDAAASGSADAISKAAAGEEAASQFELDRGNLDQALEHSKRALALVPAQLSLLLDVAYLHLRRSEDTAALDFLERARRVAPDSPDVAKLTGWAQYGMGRLPEAAAEWKHAQQLRPDPEVAQALEKAERDLQVESGFREGQSAHFILRYYGGAAPDLARASLRLLEDDFEFISGTLRFAPPEPVTVVLYTNEAFADITRAPQWVGALNDGRIRVPVQGLVTVTPELAHVLKHELTHSFIAQKTQGRSPVWLQEGIAQWMEGSRSANEAALLVSLYDHHEDPSLARLEGSWMKSPPDIAAISYAWSLAAIEAVVAAGGQGDVERLLDEILRQSSPQAAVRAALHMNYDDLNRMTAEYLRRTYLR